MRSFEYRAVVPAAGIGRRMGAGIPKQYLTLDGIPVIEHAVARLVSHPAIESVTVVIGAGDRWWSEVPSSSRVRVAAGGAERCHSVLNGLEALLQQGARGEDRILVHDAVRPCVHRGDIDRLIETVADHAGGGLLGLPVRDTMKRVDANDRVCETVPRDRLWHALTPQLFPLSPLYEALQRAAAAGLAVTDEAQAMELAGFRPIMVEGRPDNIKITRQGDMRLAALYLHEQGHRCG